ncbi:hypothetical protein ACS0TY_030151 [Phlomoides rotata]
MDRTPSKQQQKEWLVPPSPKSLEVMYQYVKYENEGIKHDVNEFFYHMLCHCPKDLISCVLLEEPPLLKAYDIYLDAVKKYNIPVMIIDSSTTSASANDNDVSINGGDGGVAHGDDEV